MEQDTRDTRYTTQEDAETPERNTIRSRGGGGGSEPGERALISGN